MVSFLPIAIAGAVAYVVLRRPSVRRRNLLFRGGTSPYPIRGTSGYDEYLAGDLTGNRRGSSTYRERKAYIKEMHDYNRSFPREPRRKGHVAAESFPGRSKGTAFRAGYHTKADVEAKRADRLGRRRR